MNTPSPINPLSPLSQQARGKSNVRLAVISIIALHAVFFGGLLLQGCKPKTVDQSLAGRDTVTPSVPPIDVAPSVPTNVALFGPGTTQPALTGDPYAHPGVALTPSVPTNETWMTSTPPPPVESVQPTLPPSTTEYVVKARDTLGQIAKTHGISLAALLQANPGIEPLRLQIGDKVLIPAAALQSGGATPAEDADAQKTTTHVVKGGENLTRIAKTYGVTVKELRAANNLKTDRILVGQKLKIPAAAPAGQMGTAETGLPPR
ncbi:MAG: LysM peptidoglycan-binding domain-containing protein [Verrucomicrobia bacterium]|jgi:LysM repeat protein|nr:LysM peptidoglycan-binding domain-containing protein [Verrucomicrobiota bacterium]OQC67896.1 MAG: Peptidoglycan endopeptidase LytF precursor [Verrucomicrobia bacterium ADurb.Bin006]MDI9382413.1 LysM peptidoglycan-binding domain-containing protein [Verrucomicrobiota bacterium]NMD19096.1 LysM peptidoglycan-binding domain-containing protein [Verrucomicrobiota bacterium]HNU98950.1 LysM peptidoglycan-binding domain-containing protein [Verrucomicrobiota bacterium]